MALRQSTTLIVFLLGLLFGLVPLSHGIEVRYARGFSVREMEGFTLVTVHPSGPDDLDDAISYVLVPKNGREKGLVREEIRKKIPRAEAAQIIATPIESIVTLSTTFLPPFSFFDRIDGVVGVDNLKNIYDPQTREKLAAKGVVEVGNGPGLNLERLLALHPEAVMANLVEGEWNVVPKLRRAGIPVLVNSDYLETSPLGRAEWVKFIALFLGAEEEAEVFFRKVEKEYLDLRKIVEKETGAGKKDRPRVFFNTPLSGRWVVPGGEGYMAAFVNDAGGDYLWRGEGGSTSLILDIETVFARAVTADIWLHQYGWNSRADALRQEPGFARIRAVKRERLVNNDARTNEYGSNDFFESGPYRPDRILADLISVFHPGVLPEHELFFYRYLGKN